MIEFYVFLVLISAAALILFKIRRITIYEYERGVKYSRGKFEDILNAGVYWYAGFFTTITKVDIRPRYVSIKGQEVLSIDGVTLKLSLAAQYEITDVSLAVNKLATPYEEAFYLILQLSLREIIGSHNIDDILKERNSFGEQIMKQSLEKIADIGLKLISVEVKDIMFPGELKKIFTQVAKAKQEGMALLEKARGETAVLRNLANSANMVKKNPLLMQLRLLHSSGNTLVMGDTTTSIITPATGGKHSQPEDHKV